MENSPLPLFHEARENVIGEILAFRNDTFCLEPPKPQYFPTSQGATTQKNSAFTGLESDSLTSTEQISEAIFSNLGPPDLCWLQREETDSSFSIISGDAQPRTFGSWHWVIGLHIPNLGAVASYFGSILNLQREKAEWSSVSTKFLHGVYRSYNPFSDTDIQVTFTVPGTISAAALRRDGTWISPVPEEMWSELHLASLLRGIQPIPSHPELFNLKTFNRIAWRFI